MLRSVALLALLVAPLLSGCGFTPLYATADEDETQVTAGLRSIAIADIRAEDDIKRQVDRELRNLLPEADGQQAAYQLELILVDERRAIAVRRSDFTSRFDYNLTGSYRLIETATGDIVHKQNVSALTSYGIVSSQYASLVGREDAVRRAAVEIARSIEVDLALFLAGRPPVPNTVELPDILDVRGRFDTPPTTEPE